MSLNTISLRERIALCKDFSPQERDFILDALGPEIAVTPSTLVDSTPNYLGRIDSIWAALSIDEGGEGMRVAPVGGMTLPLLAADKRRLAQIRPLARQVATYFKKPVRLVRFTKREDVELFQP